MFQRLNNKVRDFQHLFLFHAARSDGWCSNPYAAWLENWICVKRNRILVDRDPGAIKDLLRFLAVNFLRAKIDKHEVIVGAA